MPNSRPRKSSMTDLMAKMPVHKGSLLTSIENLLKTIESSESSVMIPTLLRDKCEFDAWELLFVAKILKASILGHSDLVEFYMNHISQQKNLVTTTSTPLAASLRQPASSPALSPATANGHPPPLPSTNGCAQTNRTGSSSSGSSTSSQASTTTGATTTGPSSSSTSWMTAASQQQTGNRSASSSLSSSSSSGNSSSQVLPPSLVGANLEPDIELAALARTLSTPSMSPRIPQPPSLLQLTTTNNHIFSRSLTSSGTIEQLANSTLQLLADRIQPQATNGGPEGALSISTTASTTNTPTTPTTPTTAAILHHELRSSRSAGCLFRNNQSSGASSPRTPLQSAPTTPCQAQAETLSNSGTQLQGDPSMPVKLLLQIEQLKSSIVYVTNLLENVVDLYKKSIDNIA